MPTDYLFIAIALLSLLTVVFLVLYIRDHLRVKTLEVIAQENDNRCIVQLQRVDELEKEVSALESDYKALAEEKNILERDYAVLHTRHEDATSSHNEKIKLLDVPV